MQETNLRIISRLKTFLTDAAKQENIKYFRLGQKSFTRERKLTFDKTVLLIANLCKKTLSIEIENFFEKIEKNPCTTAAFCQQRLKLDPVFFYSWNKVLCQNFYEEYKNFIKKWKGYRLIGCDGSNISLVNKPELQEIFGGQSNQSCSFVQAKTIYGFDVLNNIILFPMIAPYRYGELRMTYDMIEKGDIQKDMLLIFDRNFSNYKMVALLEFKETSIKYLIRVKESLIFARAFIASNKKSQVIEIFPSPASVNGLKECGYIVNSQTPLKVRLVRVELPDSKIEVLMTNLWEEEGHPAEEFKGLYAMRWGVETNIGFQKNIMQLETMSGLTAISVIQDFFATVFIANLHSLLINDAQEKLDESGKENKYPLKVNNNKSFGKLKGEIVNIFFKNNPQEILTKLTRDFMRYPLPVRKNRSFERIRKNPMTKSKYRTFTNFKPAY